MEEFSCMRLERTLAEWVWFKSAQGLNYGAEEQLKLRVTYFLLARGSYSGRGSHKGAVITICIRILTASKCLMIASLWCTWMQVSF